MLIATLVTHSKKIEMYIDEGIILNVFFSRKTKLPIVICDNFELSALVKGLGSDIDYYDIKRMTYKDALKIQKELIDG